VRLVKLALAIGAKSEGAVNSHTRRALQEGITSAELQQVALLAVTSIGWSSSMAALSWIQDVLNKQSQSD
ncbi:carboxymuconolactone decarboxylase family protein, partial [Candidatus Poribacteria bacterium]|nr:carboxymuconolactone decarboxylase family protein [Candidatus Poribacteria bacterium]